MKTFYAAIIAAAAILPIASNAAAKTPSGEKVMKIQKIMSVKNPLLI